MRNLLTRLLAPAVVLAAGVPAAADFPGRSARMNDVLLARSALAALDADPAVRDAGVVVSVVDRVAVIGGPVADPEAARRAESVVRGVPGIADVRNRCFVTAGPDPLLQAVADRMKSVPARRPFADDLPNPVYPPRATFPPDFGPAEPLIAVRPPERRDPTVSPPVTSLRITNGGLLGAPVAPAKEPTVVAARPPVSNVPGVSPGSPVPVRPASAPRQEVVFRAPLSPAEVTAVVAGWRVRDDRFRGLTVEMKGATAVVSGTAKREADAWALADAVRRLPGVDRVQLGVVRPE